MSHQVMSISRHLHHIHQLLATNKLDAAAGEAIYQG